MYFVTLIYLHIYAKHNLKTLEKTENQPFSFFFTEVSLTFITELKAERKLEFHLLSTETEHCI